MCEREKERVRDRVRMSTWVSVGLFLWKGLGIQWLVEKQPECVGATQRIHGFYVCITTRTTDSFTLRFQVSSHHSGDTV